MDNGEREVNTVLRQQVPELLRPTAVSMVDPQVPVKPVQPDLLSARVSVSDADIMVSDMDPVLAERILRTSDMTVEEADRIIANMG